VQSEAGAGKVEQAHLGAVAVEADRGRHRRFGGPVLGVGAEVAAADRVDAGEGRRHRRRLRCGAHWYGEGQPGAAAPLQAQHGRDGGDGGGQAEADPSLDGQRNPGLAGVVVGVRRGILVAGRGAR
jgi:hypothetical protein